MPEHRIFMEPLWQKGLEDFQNQKYFEAHESWEHLWREEPAGPIRELLQAAIQVAGAKHLELIGRLDASERLFRLAKQHWLSGAEIDALLGQAIQLKLSHSFG